MTELRSGKSWHEPIFLSRKEQDSTNSCTKKMKSISRNFDKRQGTEPITSKKVSSIEFGSSFKMADFCPSFSTPKKTLPYKPPPIRVSFLKFLVICFSSAKEMVGTIRGSLLKLVVISIRSSVEMVGITDGEILSVSLTEN